MNKPIVIPAYVANISTKVDKTIKIVIETQEISPDMMAALYSLHKGGTCIAAFKQSEFTEEESKALEVIELNSEELGTKTPSQRLRGALYRLWQQHPEGHESFPLYYEYRMSKFTEWVKSKID